jgi:hypothetical protein
MRIFPKTAAILIVAVSTGMGQVPQMVEGWPYLTRTEMWPVRTTPRFSFRGPLDSDAVFFNTITHEIDKFHIDASFYPGWPLIEESIFFSRTPIVVDIDHDGKDEVVTLGRTISFADYLYLVDDDGSIIPGFPLVYSSLQALNVADLDGDGQYEILTYSVDENQIYCIDRFGNSKPGWPVDLPYDMVGHQAAIGDLDLDGTNEYVVFGWKNIYAYEYSGSMHAGYPIAIYDTTYYYSYWGWGPSLADIDSDGYLEILASAGRMNDDWTYSSFAAIYEHSGDMKQNWPLMFPVGLVLQTPIAADINGDDILEIGFAVSMEELTYFVDVNGNNLPGWPSRLRYPNGELIAADIDGDRSCEIFVDYNILYPDSLGPDSTWYYGFSFLHAYDHVGEELSGYPIIAHGSYFLRPPSFGYNEISQRLYMGLFTTIMDPWENIDTGYVEIYVFPDSTGSPDQWPMVGHDNLMTRNYNFVDNATGVKEESATIPKTYMLKQNYPNPFNNSTIIEFDLPEDEFVRLTVYDILGRKVIKPVSAELAAGYHRVSLNLEDASSGMYFYILSTDNLPISRKMMLLK